MKPDDTCANREDFKPPPHIVGVLEDELKVKVDGEEAIAYLQSKEFGVYSEGCVILDPIEALYLIRRGVLEVKDREGRALSFEKYLARFSEKESDAWVKLEVYTDLRKRGLYVKPSYTREASFLVDKKKKGKLERYIVYIFTEGKRIGFAELEKAFERAMASNRKLVIAVVDKEGNVSFYTVTKMR